MWGFAISGGKKGFELLIGAEGTTKNSRIPSPAYGELVCLWHVGFCYIGRKEGIRTADRCRRNHQKLPNPFAGMWFGDRQIKKNVVKYNTECEIYSVRKKCDECPSYGEE
jgi:hypothetical protein